MKPGVAYCEWPVASGGSSRFATHSSQLTASLIIALLALVAASKAVLYDTIDPDCFWHLRVAEQLKRDGIGPLVDEISFASIKTPWTPYSWLAELGMKAIWDAGGFQLAVIAQAVLMAGFVIFLALSAREVTRGQNPLAVIVTTVVAMFLSLPYLSFRPVTFALVMLAACTWLVFRDRRMEERSLAVWSIVPITVLVINCHFFAVLVPMGIAALLVEKFWSKRSARRYITLLVWTILACCATPMLPGAVEAVWNYQFADPMVGGGVIAEFQPIWKSPTGMVIALLWIGTCIWRHDRFRIGELILVAGSFVLLMRLGRFAPAIAPILAATLANAMPVLSDRVLMRPAIRVAVVGVLVVGLIRITYALPTQNAQLDDWLNRHGPDTPGYPTAAADYVARSIPNGRIINEFTWGGYLAWRLGEDFQVLLDGRTQLYPPAFWQTMYLGDLDDAKSVLTNAGARAAILPVRRSRFRSTLLQQGWILVYHDDRAEVLFPPETSAFATP